MKNGHEIKKPSCQNNTASGFTLIELLVVVLIIGILAAVALPQYQKVVEKSRLTPYTIMMDSIVKAQELYYLENGYYAASLTDLDIDVTQSGTCKAGNNGTIKNEISCPFINIDNSISYRESMGSLTLRYCPTLPDYPSWSQAAGKEAFSVVFVYQHPPVERPQKPGTRRCQANAKRYDYLKNLFCPQ